MFYYQNCTLSLEVHRYGRRLATLLFNIQGGIKGYTIKTLLQAYNTFVPLSRNIEPQLHNPPVESSKGNIRLNEKSHPQDFSTL
jgi:hypothetical protein